MSKGKVIRNESGTTILNLETGERWVNSELPLEYWVDEENGRVHFNCPCSMSVDEFDDMSKPEISFTIEWSESYEKRLRKEAQEKDCVKYYKE